MISQESIYIPRFRRCSRSNEFLYLDIETTGLSKRNALIYLIGCAWRSAENHFCVRQWFAENPDEERTILVEFSRFAASYPMICTYNGTGFDLPFLSFRCSFHGLSDPCAEKESRDLYRILAPCRGLLGIPDMKQRSLETFLALPREDRNTGKDCVGIYRELIKYRDIGRAEPLLLHNLEDLHGILEIESLTAYLSVREGAFALESAKLGGEALQGVLRTDCTFPREILFQNQEFTLRLSGDRLDVSVPLRDGYLKNYYSDYRNYYYLPAEDTAVHRSVGEYVARNQRKPATKETCYTKFCPEESFLRDHTRLEHYFQTNIPLLLNL